MICYNQQPEKPEALGQTGIVRKDPEGGFFKLCKCWCQKKKIQNPTERKRSKMMGLRDRNMNEEGVKENKVALL